jgi:chromosome segregation ATPase
MHNNITVLAYELAVEAMGALRLLKGFESKLDQINHKLEVLLMNDEEAKVKMQEIVASNNAIVTAVTDVAGDLNEANTEINAKLAALQATIDQLQANAAGLSPELQALITDAATQTAATAASMAAVQAASQSLADIVPNPVLVGPDAPTV